jgi:molecular chaperone GrpE
VNGQVGNPGADKDMQAEPVTANPTDGVDGEAEATFVSDEPLEREEETALADALSLAEDRQQQILRLSADFENFRRRVDREREEIRAIVARELLASLLPAYDNLERALRALPDEESLSGLRKGLDMTRQSFLDGLAAQGVERVATVGRPFDPEVHEAIAQVPASAPEGTVLEEYQAGFRWRGRVLRAALVQVSAGGGEAADAPRDEPEAPDAADGSARSAADEAVDEAKPDSGGVH